MQFASVTKARAEADGTRSAVLSAATGKPGKRRSTSMSYADPDACVGCGTCARLCPTNSITMVDGKPVWGGAECTECLACVQLCLQGAAQHGDASGIAATTTRCWIRKKDASASS